jgi:hypothetical protein
MFQEWFFNKKNILKKQPAIGMLGIRHNSTEILGRQVHRTALSALKRTWKKCHKNLTHLIHLDSSWFILIHFDWFLFNNCVPQRCVLYGTLLVHTCTLYLCLSHGDASHYLSKYHCGSLKILLPSPMQPLWPQTQHVWSTGATHRNGPADIKY